ncbi:type I-C CRISPR-associated protein Cas8c/Csd1 [Murimonas intestini]|uniref:type I-C CRISPR-associated protein Cas8c/Csd1 n=1 Tax=Murimonas intestini TaxID=1337051 RepID=UPI0016529BE5|nr:type I-C CRISPR-associated protein Cas8c/Csd1 [Murimonas intestini]
MSWFKTLADTYDNISEIVGIPDENGNILLPPNHTTKSNSDVCVVINSDGTFRHASLSKLTIPIPCTNNSESRAGKANFPHPLHDQIEYLATDEKKREKYLLQLSEWSSLHPKVEAVRKYITNNTLIEDLQSCNIKISDKLFIRFSVVIPDDLKANLWEDKTVSEAWQKYCQREQSEKTELCYVTGRLLPSTDKHPKNINTLSANAKLISSNDNDNFTYRGRFNKNTPANVISIEASHKAHAMLKYLIATQAYKCGSQAIITWSIDSGSAQPGIFEDSLGIYESTIKSERDQLIKAQNVIDFNYAKALRSAFKGYGNSQKIKNNNRPIAIIAVDAATSGRMAVTFYKSLQENEYIERLINWHENCCWYFRYHEKTYISAPSTDRIIAAVYGEPKGDGYLKIKKQSRERVLYIIINGEKFSKGWLNAAVNHVSNPFSYSKADGGWDFNKWEAALNTTCAIAKKYYLDIKEEFELNLDRTKRDRDYLYGRLLAIADRIEGHARYLQDKKSDIEKRPTNAVKYMSAFATKPFRTWEVIYRQINPYIQRLSGCEGYQKEIDEIMSLFIEGEYENDKPLNGKYLMGYSLERRALNSKKNNKGDADDAE